MQPLSIRNIWSLAFLAGDGATVVSWATGTGMSLLQEFAPAIYAFIAIFCTGGLVAVNWGWLDARRPSKRFSRLSPEIEGIIRRRGRLRYGFDGEQEILDADSSAMRHKLAALRIHLPANHDEWQVTLPDLLACAKTGDITTARELWPIGTTKPDDD